MEKIETKEEKEMNMSCSEMKARYQKLIEEVQKKFSYADIPNDVYMSLVDKVVENTLELKIKRYPNKPYEVILKAKIRSELFQEIANRNQTSNQILNLLDRYVNQNFKGSMTYEDTLKNFAKLEKLCNACMFFVDTDLIHSLARKNRIFSSMVETIYQKNKSLILNHRIETLTSNSILMIALGFYLDCNHIKAKENKSTSLEELDDIPEMGEVGKASLLKREEEQSLIRRIKQGDEKAREMMVEKNLRLVAFVANRYLDHGMEFSDLFQEGSIGLLTAIDKFDPTKGTKFSTYATYWIKQAITRSIAEKSRMIHLPVKVHEALLDIHRKENQLKTHLGRVPTIEEIAVATNKEVSQVQELLQIRKQTIPVSLNATIKEDTDTEFQEIIVGEDDFTDVSDKMDVLEGVASLFERAKLKEREQKVLIYRFGLYGGEPLILEEIGKKLSITRERVRQIENKALYKLRKPKETLSFSVYMDHPEEASLFIKEMKKERPYKTRDTSRRVYETTLYERMIEYTKEEIDEVFQTIPKKQKESLYYYYGEDLIERNKNATQEERNEASRAIGTIRKRLEETKGPRRKIKKEISPVKNQDQEEKVEQTPTGKRIRNIYQYLPEYSEEEVDRVIDSLEDEDKDLLIRRYGEDLHHPVALRLSQGDRNRFYNGLVLRMRKTLSNNREQDQEKGQITPEIPRRNISTIYEYLSEYKKEEIDKVISNLTDREKNLLIKMYGTNIVSFSEKELLDKRQQQNSSSFSRNERYAFTHQLIPKIKASLEESKKDEKEGSKEIQVPQEIEKPHQEERKESLDTISYDDIKKIVTDPLQLQIMSHLTPEEAVVVSLELGLVMEKEFTIKEVAHLLKMDEDEVKSITKKGFSTYYKELNSVIDELEGPTPKAKKLGKK